MEPIERLTSELSGAERRYVGGFCEEEGKRKLPECFMTDVRLIGRDLK